MLRKTLFAVALLAFSIVSSKASADDIAKKEAYFKALYDNSDFWGQTYVRFPNGQIYIHGPFWGKALGPFLGKYGNLMVISHCANYGHLHIRDDAHIYLASKPVEFLTDGFAKAEYKMQCTLGKYTQHAWENPTIVASR